MKTKRTVGLVFFLIIGSFLFSCKTSHVVEKPIVKELNYIPYFLEVQKIKKLYDNKQYEVCYKKLDSLFNLYEPKETLFVYELRMYCDLSEKLEIYNKDRLSQFLKLIVGKYGEPVYDKEHDEYEENWNKIISKSKYNIDDLKKMFIDFKKNINYSLKDTIVEMAKRDINIRSNGNLNEKQLDSVDKINEPIIVHILKKYGYPRESLVGTMETQNPAKPVYMSFLLKHIDPKIQIMVIQPLLYQELKKGNCHPWIYGGMLDHIRMVAHQNNSPFPYYGTYSNGLIQDTLAVNTARLSIGLLKLK